MPITTCIFDAYGTLFDVNAAAALAADDPVHGAALTGIWPDLSELWRRKQLEYSWLWSTAGRHLDFWQVTQDSLDWSMEALGLHDNALRSRLLALYKELPAYAEAPAMLEALKARGMTCAILTNGAPKMIVPAVRAAGIGPFLDDVLTVEEAGIYKPSPRVYDLVFDRFAVPQSEVLFVSANGWDAAAAAGYGFASVWVNRLGEPMDRLWAAPHRILPDLSSIPELV